jgi:hypothetical protein
MIRSSFCFLERIGIGKEKKLWAQGITDWDKFLNSSRIKGIAQHRKKYYDRKIIEARKELYSLNSSYFCLMPRAEQWRLYDFFKEESVYMDIEVDNINSNGDVLLVGLSDGISTKTMIRGINLDFRVLQKELKNYKMIVTFNGSIFDLPFMKKRYPGLVPLLPQFDLRFACQKLGLTGGLKEVEKKLGIKRNKVVEEIYGGDPLLLWKRFLATGDDYYMKLLVEYNEEDVFNLKKIADYCYRELKKSSEWFLCS